MGSTGPASVNPATGKPYGALTFPVITIATWSGSPGALVEAMGIETAVLPSSAARWAACRCCSGRRTIRSACSAPSVATAAWHSPQNIAFHEVGRQAIMADPEWRGGDYDAAHGSVPAKGLAVARMAAHITYLSETALHRKFGRDAAGPRRPDLLVRRRLPGRELSAPPGLVVRRPVRRQQLSLHHPGDGLFRPARAARRGAGQRLPGARRHRFCVVSFTSDWLYPTRREPGSIVQALNAVAANVSASSRSRATRATTPSCWTKTSSSPPSAASSTQRRLSADLPKGMEAAQDE
jgi:homoserine O-acetyltransferase